MEYKAFSIDYLALLIECRASVLQYTALLIKFMALWT